jgi:hypothetical protein
MRGHLYLAIAENCLVKLNSLSQVFSLNLSRREKATGDKMKARDKTNR